MPSIRMLAAAIVLLLSRGRADVRGCLCDLARPETLSARECSLCGEAEKQPAEPAFFFVKDRNPNKPNRLLALPRFHGRNPQDLAGMSADQRTAYWTAAIGKAQELWAGEWA